MLSRLDRSPQETPLGTDAARRLKAALAKAKPSGLKKAEDRVSEIRDRLAAANNDLTTIIHAANAQAMPNAGSRIHEAQARVAAIEEELRPAKRLLETEREKAVPVIRSAIAQVLSETAADLIAAAEALDQARVLTEIADRYAMVNGLTQAWGRAWSLDLPRGADLRRFVQRVVGGA